MAGVLDNPLMQLLIGSTSPPKPIPPNASYKLRYELWLRDNHKWLLPMLDTARSLALFLPGRFQEGNASLRSEAVYTTLNLISVFHDSLLDTPRAITAELRISDPQGRQHAWLKAAQSVLLTMHYTEVLIEMAAKARFPASPLAVAGSQSKRSWLVLCAVEALKAYSRLMMLYANRGRMLTPPSQEDMVLDLMASVRAKQKAELKENERYEYEQQVKKGAGNQQMRITDAAESAAANAVDGATTAAATAPNPVTPTSDTSLIPLPSDVLPPNSSFAPFALEKGHLPPLQVQELLDLYVRHGRQTSMESTMGRPHGRFVRQTSHPHESATYRPPAGEVVSEVLHLLRPVVYTAARAACHREPNSWTPWILSLAVDAASRALAPRLSSLSPSEHQEVLTRMRGYLFYLLRDPMFSNVVAGPLGRFSALLARVPLIGAFFSSMLNLIFSIQKYYFYTSAS